MANAIDVAHYLLALGTDEDSGDSVSNLKLQKLLYYCQGIHLALHGTALFSDPITAWKHGPVCIPVYERFKVHKGNPIPPVEFDATATLTDEERAVIEDVSNVYGQFSAWRLREMTHDEAPWKETPEHGVIAHEAMRRFFLTCVE